MQETNENAKKTYLIFWEGFLAQNWGFSPKKTPKGEFSDMKISLFGDFGYKIGDFQRFLAEKWGFSFFLHFSNN